MTYQKRKQFWVDSPLQLQMMGYVLFLVSASLLLVIFSVLRGLSAASAQSRQIFHSLDWVRDTMFAPLLLASTLAILASAVVALIWSHRFAGPLRVLSAGFGRMRHLNLSQPVKVRDTDSHQELVREFAESQEKVRAALAEERKKLHEAAKALEHDPHSAHKVAKELRSALEQFQL